jgi:hypothetical protein
MKIRIGMTAPLRLQRLDQAQLLLPAIIERNFAFTDALDHAIWLSGTKPLSAPAITPSTQPAESTTLRLSIADSKLLDRPAVTTARTSGVQAAWTDLPVNGQQRTILQEVAANPGMPPRKLVLVVDLSKSMHPHLQRLCDMLAQLPEGTEISVIGASDAVADVTNGAQRSGAALVAALKKSLPGSACAGGADNLPALMRGWDMAEASGSQLLWIHGPQPEVYLDPEAMLQRLEGSPLPAVRSLQMVSGPNRLLERMESFIPTTSIASGDTTALASHLTPDPWIHTRRELRRQESPPAGSVKASNHVARLWAADVARRMKSRDDATRLAVQYQLVTSATGAVVLETAAQYAANQLEASNADTVPTVPEPSSFLLLLSAAASAVCLRRRRQRLPGECLRQV